MCYSHGGDDARSDPGWNSVKRVVRTCDKSQTPAQITAGELSFKQVRELVLQIHELVKGDGTPSRPGHDNVVIQLNALTTQLTEMINRIEKVETTAAPVLLKADEELKKLQVRSDDIYEKMSGQLEGQRKKHDDLRSTLIFHVFFRTAPGTVFRGSWCRSLLKS